MTVLCSPTPLWLSEFTDLIEFTNIFVTYMYMTSLIVSMENYAFTIQTVPCRIIITDIVIFSYEKIVHNDDDDDDEELEFNNMSTLKGHLRLYVHND